MNNRIHVMLHRIILCSIYFFLENGQSFIKWKVCKWQDSPLKANAACATTKEPASDRCRDFMDRTPPDISSIQYKMVSSLFAVSGDIKDGRWLIKTKTADISILQRIIYPPSKPIWHKLFTILEFVYVIRFFKDGPDFLFLFLSL